MNKNIIASESQMTARENEMEKQERREKREKEKAPYDKFVRLNTDWNIQKALFSIADNPIATKLLLFFAMNCAWDNTISVSIDDLAEFFATSGRTIRRGLQELKEHGFIVSRRTGSASEYTVNPAVSWNSWNTNWAKCKFPTGTAVTSSKSYKKKPHIIKN